MFQFLGAYPLIELFNRADVRVLLWLNHFVASRPELYALAFLLADRGADLLIFVTLLLLWFWPAGERTLTVFAEPELDRRPTKKASQRRGWLATITQEDEYQPLLTRLHSRAQVLLVVGGGVAAYLVARLLAFQLNVNRPFASYWMVKHPPSLPGAFDDLRTFGSFPSEHAAMLAALACALYFWNWRLGAFWTVAALLLALCHVAVGIHYPLDLFGGALMGLAIVWPLLRAYRRRGALFNNVNVLAEAFDRANAPYCYLLYFLLLLLGLEAASHFQHLWQMLFSVRAGIFGPPGH